MQRIVAIFNAYLIYPVIIGYLIIAGSCSNTKKALYFSGIRDSSLVLTPPPETYIQSNDLLSINVSSLNPQASEVFNTSNESAKSSAGSIAYTSGYLVNKDGNIQFPMLGNIKAAGYTKDQLKDILTKQLVKEKYLIDPVVTIRYLNFKVTVLGEVAKPGVMAVPSEKISMLEAIGLAGDLTIYAKRKDILLIREENGQKITRRLNLNDGNILNSPYYYLQSNDIIYVEPGKTKINSASGVFQWLPAVLGGLTFITILADRLIQ